MGEVQSSYIHPDINQSAQHLFAIARRPYRCYNFGPLRRSAHFSILAKARPNARQKNVSAQTKGKKQKESVSHGGHGGLATEQKKAKRI
jgi:hypothetical protein